MYLESQEHRAAERQGGLTLWTPWSTRPLSN